MAYRRVVYNVGIYVCGSESDAKDMVLDLASSGIKLPLSFAIGIPEIMKSRCVRSVSVHTMGQGIEYIEIETEPRVPKDVVKSLNALGFGISSMKKFDTESVWRWICEP